VDQPNQTGLVLASERHLAPVAAGRAGFRRGGARRVRLESLLQFKWDTVRFNRTDSPRSVPQTSKLRFA
jgi:hypothetical protein